MPFLTRRGLSPFPEAAQQSLGAAIAPQDVLLEALEAACGANEPLAEVRRDEKKLPSVVPGRLPKQE